MSFIQEYPAVAGVSDEEPSFAPRLQDQDCDHSTLGSRVIKKKKSLGRGLKSPDRAWVCVRLMNHGEYPAVAGVSDEEPSFAPRLQDEDCDGCRP